MFIYLYFNIGCASIFNFYFYSNFFYVLYLYFFSQKAVPPPPPPGPCRYTRLTWSASPLLHVWENSCCGMRFTDFHADLTDSCVGGCKKPLSAWSSHWNMLWIVIFVWTSSQETDNHEESYVQWSVCDSGRKLRTVVCLWLWKKVTYSGLCVTLEESYVQWSVCDSGRKLYTVVCLWLWKKVIYSGLCVTLEESYIQWSVCDSGRKLYTVVCVWLWKKVIYSGLCVTLEHVIMWLSCFTSIMMSCALCCSVSITQWSTISKSWHNHMHQHIDVAA